jgi:membrane protein DedA with SNARE-associated domain
LFSDLGSYLQSSQTLFQGFWVYVLIGFLVMVEGPVTILLAAGFSETGTLHLLPVFCAATVGNLIGDTLWYCLGYFGQTRNLASLRPLKFLHLDSARIERLKNVINSHAVKLLLFAKVTNGLIVPVLISTGVARVSMKRWMPTIVITNLLNSAVFLALGYFMTSSLRQIQKGYEYIAIFASLAVFLAATFLIPRWLSKRDLLTELEKEKDVPKPD